MIIQGGVTVGKTTFLLKFAEKYKQKVAIDSDRVLDSLYPMCWDLDHETRHKLSLNSSFFRSVWESILRYDTRDALIMINNPRILQIGKLLADYAFYRFDVDEIKRLATKRASGKHDMGWIKIAPEWSYGALKEKTWNRFFKVPTGRYLTDLLTFEFTLTPLALENEIK